MKEVYIVFKIFDFIYGNTEVVGVFSNQSLAEFYINNQIDNHNVFVEVADMALPKYMIQKFHVDNLV